MRQMPSPNQISPVSSKITALVVAAFCSHTGLSTFFAFVTTGEFVQKNMQKYLVLVKLNPLKTNAFFNAFSSLSQNPVEGVNISGSYNVFGVWDIAIWFEADSNDDALHFVGDKIRSMDGVVETHTMPATTIKEYMSSSKNSSSSSGNM
jgi:uncharacterized protein with GYD domain